MYTVTFCESNESKHKFFGVDEIAVGEQLDMLERITAEDIYKHTFPIKAFYQLTGKNLNVTFDALRHQCIFVQIEQG